LIEIGLSSLEHPKTDFHNELDCCKGVLTLQSLLLKCHEIIPPAMWSKMLEKAMKRLQEKGNCSLLNAK
jgi:hypothetical protein